MMMITAVVVQAAAEVLPEDGKIKTSAVKALVFLHRMWFCFYLYVIDRYKYM